MNAEMGSFWDRRAEEDAFFFVDNRLDTRSGTVRMRAVVDNKDGKLTPGLYARVKLSNGTQTRPAVLVSDRAIGTGQPSRMTASGTKRTVYWLLAVRTNAPASTARASPRDLRRPP